MRSVLSSAPLDLVDLLFYFERLEVIEFWLVGLKFSMKFVLACFLLSTVSLASHLMPRTLLKLTSSMSCPKSY